MKTQLSFAVLCLIGAINAVNVVADIGTGSLADLSENSEIDAYAEANRFIGADGRPIMLAQTEGHARIVMERIQKYDTPQPLDIINL
jgi:hypothetical protein